MNIFYFSSDLFIEVLAVSLVSLLENNKNCKEINVYIVDDGITKEKKNKLQGMVDKYSSTENIRKIIYLDAPSPNDLLKFNFNGSFCCTFYFNDKLITLRQTESNSRELIIDVCYTTLCAKCFKYFTMWN